MLVLQWLWHVLVLLLLLRAQAALYDSSLKSMRALLMFAWAGIYGTYTAGEPHRFRRERWEKVEAATAASVKSLHRPVRGVYSYDVGLADADGVSGTVTVRVFANVAPQPQRASVVRFSHGGGFALQYGPRGTTTCAVAWQKPATSS